MEISGAERIDKLVYYNKQIILVSDIHTDFRDKSKQRPLYVPKFIENIISHDPKKKWNIYLEQGISTQNNIPDLKFLELLNTYFLQDEFDIPEKQEKYYYNKFIKNGSTLLALTKSYFGSKGCFLEKNRCHIPNGNFHFIDIRQKNIGNCYLNRAIPFTRFYNHLFSYLKTIKIWNKKNINIKLIEFKNELLLAIDDLFNCKKEIKILKQIGKSIYKKELILFFQKTYNSSLNILEDVYNIWKTKGDEIIELMTSDLLKQNELNIKKINFKKTIEFLNNQYKKLGTIDLINLIERKYKDNIFTSKTEAPLVSISFIIYTSTLMNMYILGRITKPYNKNVIVIAGINHINYVKDFLIQMDWDINFESKKITNKRVLIPNIFESGSDSNTELIITKLNFIKKTKKNFRKKIKHISKKQINN